MTATEFINFQEFVLQVFGPWLQVALAVLIVLAFFLAALFPFLTLFRLMTRRP